MPLVLFLLFPFVGLIPNIDIQPLFFFYGLGILIICLYKIEISIISICGFFLIFSLLFLRFIVEIDYLSLTYILKYSLSILTPFLIYILIKNNILIVKRKHLVYAALIYSVVGIIQLFYPYFLVGLVSRSPDAIESLIQSNRGVRSLAPEPADYGKVLATLNILLIFSFSKFNYKYSTNKLLTYSFVLLLVNAITSQSAYAVVYHTFIFLLLLVVLRRGRHFILYGSILVLLGISYYLYASETGSRILIILQAVFTNSELLMEQGAFRRLMNIPININNALEFGIFGAGNSTERIPTSIPTIFGEFSYLASNRNLGGFIEYVLKFGVLSIPIFLFYFYMLFEIALVKTTIENETYRIGLWLSIVLFMYSIQDGSPNNPLTWFSIIYIYMNKDWLRVKSIKVKNLDIKG